MSLFIADQLLAQNRAGTRECGVCTACCSVLPILELRKPMRRACDHVCQTGCSIHAERPTSCHDFHCLWLRGALDGDEGLRPDQLGVMFDYFVMAPSGCAYLIAFELWVGAFGDPQLQALLQEIGRTQTVRLSYRDGRWSTLTAENTANTDPSVASREAVQTDGVSPSTDPIDKHPPAETGQSRIEPLTPRSELPRIYFQPR